MNYLCNHITEPDSFQAWVLSQALPALSREADSFLPSTPLKLFREREP